MKKRMQFLFIIIAISTILITGCSGNNKETGASKNYNSETETNNNSSSVSKTEKEKYSEEEYKSMCETLDYKTIARSPDNFIDKKIYGTGEIIQVIDESEEMATFRINVTPVMDYENKEVSYYKDTVVAIIYHYDLNNRLLENDIIDFWGLARGNYTYETVLGNSETVPLIQIDYYNLK